MCGVAAAMNQAYLAQSQGSAFDDGALTRGQGLNVTPGLEVGGQGQQHVERTAGP